MKIPKGAQEAIWSGLGALLSGFADEFSRRLARRWLPEEDDEEKSEEQSAE